MSIIETAEGTITIERIETGAFWFLAEWDNGAHPNSPYIETFEHEDGPFSDPRDAEWAARTYMQATGERF